MARKQVKITKKLMKQKKKTCADCANYYEVENETVIQDEPMMIGMCKVQFNGVTDNLCVHGARTDNKYCGLIGRFFKDKNSAPDKPKMEREEEPIKIEDMPLEDLEEVKNDKELWAECSIGEKARISKQINKLKKEAE